MSPVSILMVLLLASSASGAPATATDPVGAARKVLADYDAAVKKWKTERGHNVTLQLEDPVPEVLAAWAGTPLPRVCERLRDLLEKQPKHPTARLVLAQLESRQGHLGVAADELEDHVALHPEDASAWNLLGVACSRIEGSKNRTLGQAAGKRKLEAYRTATRLAPHDATAWANLSNALAASGRPAGSVEAGLKAVKLREHYVYAWMNLGVAYGLMKKTKEEKEAYLAAIEVPPDDEQCPFARFNLALCFEQEKDYAGAIRWYRDALRVGLPQGPRSRQAALFHHNLARALYHNDEFTEATKEATEALKIDSRLPEPHSLLGHLFEKAGQPEQARKLFLAATRLLAKYGESKPDARLPHAP